MHCWLKMGQNETIESFCLWTKVYKISTTSTIRCCYLFFNQALCSVHVVFDSQVDKLVLKLSLHHAGPLRPNHLDCLLNVNFTFQSYITTSSDVSSRTCPHLWSASGTKNSVLGLILSSKSLSLDPKSLALRRDKVLNHNIFNLKRIQSCAPSKWVKFHQNLFTFLPILQIKKERSDGWRYKTNVTTVTNALFGNKFTITFKSKHWRPL